MGSATTSTTSTTDTASTETTTTMLKKLFQQLVMSTLLIVGLQSLTTFVVTSVVGVDDPWQRLWNKVIDVFGDDEYNYHIFGTALVIFEMSDI